MSITAVLFLEEVKGLLSRPPLRSIAAGSSIEPAVCCHIVDVDDYAATSSGAFLHRRSIVEELLLLPPSA